MRKIKGLRWYMIALVTLGTVLGYLTRNTVAAAAPTLMEELNISTQQYSYIIAAYSAAYTVMQPVAGYVLDVLGTKIGYAMFAVLWAVFCGATALAGSWGGLAVARGAVGAAEAAMIPAGLKASSEWFPAKERSIAVGYFNVGSSIGAMIAPPLVVWAIVMHSWQMAFIISGALSFIWAMAWLIFYKHPRDQKHLTDEEREQIETMKIALIGYGKMGKEIEKIALGRGHEIVSIIDVDNQEDFESAAFKSADVAIEFTNPMVAYNNYMKAFRAGVKLVSGSTEESSLTAIVRA